MPASYIRLSELKITVPDLGSGPDWFSFWTHATGMLLSIVGTVKLLAESSHLSISASLSCCVYGICMIFLYLSSSLHHAAKSEKGAVDMLRRLDHVAIYCFIAATYTPYCVICLKPVLGSSIMLLVWGMGLAGAYQKVFCKFTSRWVTIGAYIVMGWTSIFLYFPLNEVASPTTVNLLLGGGILYTVGALVYALKFPDPLPNVVGFHGIWHIFVLAASACHYGSIVGMVQAA